MRRRWLVLAAAILASLLVGCNPAQPSHPAPSGVEIAVLRS